VRVGLSCTVFGPRQPDARDFAIIASNALGLVDLCVGSNRIDLREPAPLAAAGALVTAAGLELACVTARLGDAGLAAEQAAAIGCPMIVAVSGPCSAHGLPAPGGPAALRRAIDAAVERAAAHRVRLAVEFPADFAPEAVVDLLEDLDGAPVGACLDTGHAQRFGGAAEAIDTLSGLIAMVHLDDTIGHEDDHRAPHAGSIDWPAVLTALWKTGYAGPGLIELPPAGDVPAALARAVGARGRLQAILDDLAQPMVFPE
jgi:sugar phosphate isomerase/epimerase